MPSTAQSHYGRRLVVDIVDDVANKTPNRTFLCAPRSGNPHDGWNPITYAEFANAVNCVAHIVQKEVTSKSSAKFPAVAYVGPIDARYCVITLACIKAGAQAFLISPRNSFEGGLSLLERMNCNHFWYAESLAATAEPWVKRRSMSTFNVPSMDTWVRSSTVPFPYEKTFEEAEWDPFVVLHTSGSTGIPKPIVIRQGSIAIGDGYHNLPNFFFSEWAQRSSKIFVSFPLFHAAGLLGAFVMMAIFFERPIMLPISDRPMSSDLIRECLIHAQADTAMLAPSSVEELSKYEDGVAALKKIKSIVFGGGSLPRDVGDGLIRQGILLHNVISSTEIAPYALCFQDSPKMWQYFNFDMEAMGAEWRSVDKEENTYELIFRRKHPDLPMGQLPFYALPDLKEFPTGDVYKPHPELPDNWLLCGRVDDVIVFTNGEKLNPVTMEKFIETHSAIKGALVVGQGKFQPAVLLEPYRAVHTTEEAKVLIDEVWPLIEKANEETVAHGRLVRRLVMVADANIPFYRTPKGTIQRKMTVSAYREHVEQRYREAADADEQRVFHLDFSSRTALEGSLTTLISTELGLKELQPESDLFNRGIDSLQVMSISTALKASVRAAEVELSADAMSPRVIYGNPSAVDLASYMLSMTSNDQKSATSELEHEIETLEAYVSKYTGNMPRAIPNKPEPLTYGQTVLLTGSTGSLGAYMLDTLCSATNVKKVFALNRGSDGGKSRQDSISAARGLTLDFSKVEFLGGDLSQSYFGLGAAKYSELLSIVDRVIHNAWPVNFNMSISSFEPSIQGVRHLADFSNAATKRVPIIFLSSIGTVDRWALNDAIPEEPFKDLSLPSLSYGRSKQAGSLILDEAALQSGVPAASVRIGQIAGPKAVKGRWNPQEMFPTLIASSLYLGVLPDHPGTGQMVDWMPIEDVADTILDIAGVKNSVAVDDISGYFHLVNPNKTSWSILLSALRQFYGDRIKGVVSYADWVSALAKSATPTANVSRNPGIKLLDTYQNLATQGSDPKAILLETRRTEKLSPTMADFSPLTIDLIKNWCKQWNF